MAVGSHQLEELRGFDDAGEYDVLIAGLRERVAASRRVFADAWVKDWCGRRRRNLFSAASEDGDAVNAAGKRLGLPGTDLSVVSRVSDDRSEAASVVTMGMLSELGVAN